MEDKINGRNEMRLSFDASSRNESFARAAAGAFAAQLNPTVSELSDIKTAVSEAVTNAVIHGYDNSGRGVIELICVTENSSVYIEVSDNGVGISDIEKAREPLYTSKPDGERSGMGFTVMETFMDEVSVFSETGKGTRVTMKKYITSGERYD